MTTNNAQQKAQTDAQTPPAQKKPAQSPEYATAEAEHKTDEGAQAQTAADAKEQTAADANAQTAADAKAQRRKKIMRAILITLGIVLILIILLLSTCAATRQTEQAGDWYDPAAQRTVFSNRSLEEIIDDLNARVEAGMMNISVSSVLRFPDGTDNAGQVRLQNSSGNHVDQKIVITLSGSDEVLYESAALAPGYSIDQITLTRALDPGSYTALITFIGFDRETHKETGRMAAEVPLIVG